MLTVVSCSRSYGFCHLRAGRLSITGITSLQIQRSFASHTPNNEGETKSSLAGREVKVQKPHTHDQVSATRSHKKIDLEKLREKILRKLKKRGLTVEGGMCKGPVPDGLDYMLGWAKIEQGRIERNMLPERREQIEKLAAKGDPLSQLRLKQIIDYEKRYLAKNTQE